MDITIKENGEIRIPFSNHAGSVIYVGDLDGAAIHFEVKGIPITDSTLTDNTQLMITHGFGANVKAVTTDLSTPVELSIYPV